MECDKRCILDRNAKDEYDCTYCPGKASSASIEDLAMFVRRLIRAVQSERGDTSLTEQAKDYLRKHSLEGCIFR